MSTDCMAPDGSICVPTSTVPAVNISLVKDMVDIDVRLPGIGLEEEVFAAELEEGEARPALGPLMRRNRHHAQRRHTFRRLRRHRHRVHGDVAGVLTIAEEGHFAEHQEGLHGGKALRHGKFVVAREAQRLGQDQPVRNRIDVEHPGLGDVGDQIGAVAERECLDDVDARLDLPARRATASASALWQGTGTHPAWTWPSRSPSRSGSAPERQGQQRRIGRRDVRQAGYAFGGKSGAAVQLIDFALYLCRHIAFPIHETRS